MIDRTNKLRLRPLALPIASSLGSDPKNSRAMTATTRKAAAPARGADHFSARIHRAASGNAASSTLTTRSSRIQQPLPPAL